MDENDKGEFKRLLGKRACSCTSICDCIDLLKKYFNDPSAPYPNGKKQLLFRIRNPSKDPEKSSSSSRAGQLKFKQQFYDQAANLLSVKNASTRNDIFIGIHHFHRDVIVHYNNDSSKEKPKSFPDYLLPSALSSRSRISTAATASDAGKNPS